MPIIPMDDFNAIVVSPAEAMIDWVNSVFPHSPSEYRQQLEHDGATVYLIPGYESHEEAIEWLKDNFEEIFEEELFGWVQNDAVFPEITWENFNKYCKVSYQSMVHMAVDEEE